VATKLESEKIEIKWKNTLDFYMEPRTIAVMDIETTGLDPDKELIVEIGICELNLRDGTTKKLFDHIVKEPNFSEKHQTSWIFLNSTLKFEDVSNAAFLESFRAELHTIFSTYKITAYNKKFDFGFLTRRGFTFKQELACPMIISTPILKIPFPIRPNSYIIDLNKPFRPENQYKYPSVEEAWRYYISNEPYKESHRAYDDAVHEARIVYEMYKKEYFKIDF
jgi:DNA polymerase-3 subunit epsilon